MLVPTLVLALLSLVAFFFAYQKGEHMKGLMMARNLTIQVLPLLIFAFILAGMLQVMIPEELIAKWIGEESGLKGIVIGAIAGGFLPGGPYVTLPVVAGLAKVGASIPVLVAVITGWSLIGVSRLPMELGILGPKLTLIRLASVIIFAPLAGIVAQVIVKVLNSNS